MLDCKGDVLRDERPGVDTAGKLRFLEIFCALGGGRGLEI